MIPQKYKWLETIGTLPKMVAAAIQYFGIKEVPGKGSNPVIMDMAKGLGLEKIYTNDDISWCALFINHLFRITGKPALKVGNDPYNYLRAKYLLNWGVQVQHGDERLGDVAIFDREGGGHVGIVIAISGSTIHILGGNQGNTVSIVEISKARLLGARRYYSIAPPESAIAYEMDSNGHLSKNEA